MTHAPLSTVWGGVVVLTVIIGGSVLLDIPYAPGSGNTMEGTLTVESSSPGRAALPEGAHITVPDSPVPPSAPTAHTSGESATETLAPPENTGSSPVPTSEDLLRAYGNRVAGTITADTSTGQQEVEAFNAFLDDRESEDARDMLQSVGTRYREAAEALAELSVPAAAEALHADLVASSRGLASAIDALLQQPAHAPLEQSLESYDEQALRFGTAFLNLATFFKEEGMQFAPGESGAIFRLPF